MVTHMQYFRRFLECDFIFFKGPLPESEEEYNFRYSLAKTNWNAICEEINMYSIKDQTKKQLEEFFAEAKKFTFKLKASEASYSRTKLSLQNDWEKLKMQAMRIAY